MIQCNSMAVFIRYFAKAMMNDFHPSAEIDSIIGVVANREERNYLVIFIIDIVVIVSDRVIG